VRPRDVRLDADALQHYTLAVTAWGDNQGKGVVMESVRARRFLAVGGLVFVLLLVVSIAVVPNISSHASAAKITSFAHDHKTGLRVSAIAIVLAIVVGLFFFWYLRDYLSTAASGRVENVAFAGAVLFAVSGGVSAGYQLTLADAVGHADASAFRALNLLYGNFNFAMTAASVIAMLVAYGIATIRTGQLARWIGWLAIVLGVVSIIGVGALAAGLWILVVSVALLVRAGRSPTTPATDVP